MWHLMVRYQALTTWHLIVRHPVLTTWHLMVRHHLVNIGIHSTLRYSSLHIEWRFGGWGRDNCPCQSVAHRDMFNRKQKRKSKCKSGELIWAKGPVAAKLLAKLK